MFYTPDILSSPFLPEEESLHAVKVLRLKAGDEIELLDGKGRIYQAKILYPHPKHCEVEILMSCEGDRNPPFHLHIAIAPTKNMDRMEWFAEKVTEIGISEITPVICRFSERKVIKHERLEKILVSAMKQSRQAYLPRLNPSCSFKDFVGRKISGQKVIGHCYEDNHKEYFSAHYIPLNDVTILIGPEGDFSEEEVKLAVKNGFTPVSLGNTRLRTETAGLAACHTALLLSDMAAGK
jgi:16S rRNA (uracil1498-N3)-methyltransferase